MTSWLLGLAAMVSASPSTCLLRDPSVSPPPTLFGRLRTEDRRDPCPPDRVRDSELPLVDAPPSDRSADAPPGVRCAPHGCWAWAGVGERRALRAAGAELDVFAPAVGPGEHSLIELSVHGGPDLRDVIEIGWTVSPRKRPDGRPVLLVQRWSHGELLPGTGGFHPWSSGFAAGMDLSPWLGRSIQVGWRLWEGRWWAWFEGAWLGWYEADAWSPPFRGAAAAQWFGEVFFTGATPAIGMGNDRHASEPDAARVRSLCSMGPEEERCGPPRSIWPRLTDSARYGVVVEAADRFRLGGSGEIRPRPPPSSASEGTPPATGR